MKAPEYIDPRVAVAAEAFADHYNSRSGFMVREGMPFYEAMGRALEAADKIAPPIVSESTATESGPISGSVRSISGTVQFNPFGVKSLLGASLNGSFFCDQIRAAADTDPSPAVEDDDIVATAERIALDRIPSVDLAWEASRIVRSIADDFAAARKAGTPDDVAEVDERIGDAILIFARIGRRYGYTIDEAIQSFIASAEKSDDGEE